MRVALMNKNTITCNYIRHRCVKHTDRKLLTVTSKTRFTVRDGTSLDQRDYLNDLIGDKIHKFLLYSSEIEVCVISYEYNTVAFLLFTLSLLGNLPQRTLTYTNLPEKCRIFHTESRL